MEKVPSEKMRKLDDVKVLGNNAFVAADARGKILSRRNISWRRTSASSSLLFALLLLEMSTGGARGRD